MDERKRNLELDKICRVCLSQKKDMRPIFGEMIADMLMECARVKIENTDGWPDKICIQCVHSVSRCHAFKTLVERSDRELRDYIKGLTVIFEEPVVEIKTQPPSPSPTIIPRKQQQQQQNQQQQQQQQQTQKESTKSVATTAISTNQVQTIQPRAVQTAALPQQIVLSNGQVISTAQIVAHPGTQMAQIVNAGQFGQLIQTGNTVQMIQQNGQPAQMVQFQQADGDDGQCEIIVRDDMSQDAEYFEDVTEVTTHDDIETTEDIIEIQDEEEMIEDEQEDCMIPDSGIAYTVEMSEESDSDEKIYLEFISSQTSCPSPGRYICNLCRKEFKQIKWLQSHMKSHSNWIKANCKKQPQCEICHRSFKGPGMLRMHMKTHETAEKIPTCSICHKQFKSKTILYRHRQTHQLKSFACGNCSKAFSSPLTLNSHMTKKHPNEPSQYKCAECQELFASIDELKVHIQLTGHSVKNDKKDDESSS